MKISPDGWFCLSASILIHKFIVFYLLPLHQFVIQLFIDAIKLNILTESINHFRLWTFSTRTEMVNTFSQCTETIKRIHTGVLWPYNVALYCRKCDTKTGILKVMSYNMPKMFSSIF